MKEISLPKPTSQCDSSPIVIMSGADTTIKYSFEDDKIYWIALKFNTIYGFKYTECEYVNTTEYVFGLVEIENSEWINELINAWKSLDRSIERAFGGGISKISHYRLYFDDYGMYEIISKGLEIIEHEENLE